MSLSSEITRIETAKADIAAAIEEKGVTVPDDTKIDGMAALISGITAGSGGLPTGISAIATGTVTPTADSEYINVNHRLGVTPNFLVWIMEENRISTPLTSANIYGAVIGKQCLYKSGSTLRNIYVLRGGYNQASTLTNLQAIYMSEDYMTTTTARIAATSAIKLKSGYTYRWVCGVIDGIE